MNVAASSPFRPGPFPSAILIAVAFGFTLMACTASESVDFDAGPSGSAGRSTSSGAGTTGATSTGVAGSTTGAAGSTAGAGGTTSGHAGASGQGSAGRTGSAGATGAGGAKIDAGAPDKGSSGGAGASGNTDGGLVTDSGYPLTYTAYILPMLNNACGGCHFDGGSMAPKGGFGYTSYAKLVGPVSGATAGCTALDSSKRRVVPGKPENSLIFIKVSVSNPPAGCGGHMPYMGTNMSAQNQADLKAWILAGAPE